MREPQKEIREIGDMTAFQASPARHMLGNIIESLANAVVGVEVPDKNYHISHPLAQDVYAKLSNASKMVDEIPPLQTPQRFGNPAYRDWLLKCQPLFESEDPELNHYLFNAFGSSQRIDYGTGHELSFIAYWDALFRNYNHENDKVLAEDVLTVFAAYFDLCRKVILTYKLEPAGSHGVWGLDDHVHLPYILGAAQLMNVTPGEYPEPKDVLNETVVNREKERNLYFGAIAFIYRVKRGAFFEHSPILYDVSGIKNWAKVKSGMIKMYNGEVLAKFPVVQHFYFGDYFPFRETPADPK